MPKTVLLSALEKDVTLYLNKFVFHLPKKMCVIFGWNWRRGCGEEDFKKLAKWIYTYSLCCYYIPLGKGNVLHLKGTESSLPKYVLCQVLLTLSRWFWKRIIVFIIFIWKHASFPVVTCPDGQHDHFCSEILHAV